MNIWTKLSGSALCAALLAGSSGLAVHAQNALVTVNSQGMSEATAVRVGCGVAIGGFGETVSNAAVSTSTFGMQNIVGVLAGLAVAAIAIAVLPEPNRGKCIRLIKNLTKFVFYLFTCGAVVSMYGDILAVGFTLLCVPIALFMSRKFWGEFFTCFSLPSRVRAEQARERELKARAFAEERAERIRRAEVRQIQFAAECAERIRQAELKERQIAEARVALERQFQSQSVESVGRELCRNR